MNVPLPSRTDDELVACGVTFPARPVGWRRVAHDQSPGCVGACSTGRHRLRRRSRRGRNPRSAPRGGPHRPPNPDGSGWCSGRTDRWSIGGRNRSSHRSPPERLSTPNLPHRRAGSLPNIPLSVTPPWPWARTASRVWISSSICSGFEQAVRSLGRDIGERRLVEAPGFDDTVLRQVIDDEV